MCCIRWPILDLGLNLNLHLCEKFHFLLISCPLDFKADRLKFLELSWKLRKFLLLWLEFKGFNCYSEQFFVDVHVQKLKEHLKNGQMVRMMNYIFFHNLIDILKIYSILDGSYNPAFWTCIFVYTLIYLFITFAHKL